MTEIEERISRLGSDDQAERSQALAGLVGDGADATEALTQALTSDDDRVRRAAAQALAEIADPAAEATYRAMVDDRDGAVRGRGAQGLHAIGAAGAAEALAATINELPDQLRSPFTLAVYALVARGIAGAAAAAPLLDSADRLSRERGLLVIRMVADQPAGPAGLAQELAGYDPATDPAGRDAVADRVTSMLGG
jgi:HEAT repeat protein